MLTTKDLVDLASNRTFCAGRGDGKGICTGDSGGGVSIKVASTFYFRGIVSSGLFDGTSCDVSKYSVFTDVLKFKAWIDHIMREDGEIFIQNVVRANLRCTIELVRWTKSIWSKPKFLQTCDVYDQKIDGEGFSVAGDPNESIQGFYIWDIKDVKFLPENIAEAFPGLIAYKVRSCSIRTVNGNHFKGLNKLESLNLPYNEIESIDGDSFKDLTNLEDIDLSYNKIKTVDPHWFQSLETLLVFYIDHNKLEFLDEKIFDNLQNLRNITLTNNKLATIPANLFKNNLKLEWIWLNENKIQTISSTMFDHLKNLSRINLKNNVCVNRFYYHDRFNEMKNVLSAYCTSINHN